MTIDKISQVSNTLSYQISSINMTLDSHDTSITKFDDKLSEMATKVNNIDLELVRISSKLDAALNERNDLKQQLADLKKSSISVDQFTPVQRAIYFVATFVVTGVLGAVLNLVIKK
jgi:chromosome segregation ATPase